MPMPVKASRTCISRGGKLPVFPLAAVQVEPQPMTAAWSATLSLSHFRRSTGRAGLALGRGGPVALFGPNGRGQRPTLMGRRCRCCRRGAVCAPGQAPRRSSPLRRPEANRLEDHVPRSRGARASGPVRVELTAETGGRPASPGSTASRATQTALAAAPGIVWLVPAQDRLWDRGSGRDGGPDLDSGSRSAFCHDHAEAQSARL